VKWSLIQGGCVKQWANAAAEPLQHYARPPQSLGWAASSPKSARFALAALDLLWTFVPDSI
jgi:hypothetical protein